METPLDFILFVVVYLIPILMWASALLWACFVATPACVGSNGQDDGLVKQIPPKPAAGHNGGVAGRLFIPQNTMTEAQ